MKPVITVFTLFGSLLIGACGQVETKESKPYNKDEKNRMTICVGLADTAHTAALKKKSNTPKQKLLDYYADKPNAKMTMATVEKVYASEFKSVYSYAIDFFNECALKIANVEKTRRGLASYCMQNQLIADYGYRFRKAGKEKQKAYDYFAAYKNETVNRMIDFGYTTQLTRAKMKLLVWNQCMEKITES